MLFFDGVVEGEVVAELLACVEEGADGHAAWSSAGAAGVIEEVPGLAEVFVLAVYQRFRTSIAESDNNYEVIHMLSHMIVYAKFL